MGYISSYGFSGENAKKYIWGANVFKAERDNEAINEIAFHTTDHEAKYDLYIYDLGTETPTAPVKEGLTALVTSTDNSVKYAGYHTRKFDKPIEISKDHYFSIVMRMEASENSSAKPWAIEMKSSNYAEPVFNRGESYASFYYT